MQAPLQARNDSDAAQTDTIRTVAQKRVLADNRPKAVAQRKLAEMMNNSPRVLQQRALSDAIHNSPRMVAQRHEMNALFGGAVKPQGDGAMPAEASLAQREEKTNKTGLPNQLKSGIESLSGMSMDHVTVHYNSDRPAQLQAHAYAQGSEIHLGAGQERHLPHEAWHVVQQAQGRVRPTLQMKAGAVNDDPSLEKEADMMGEKAAQFEDDHGARNLVAEERVAGAVTQRVAGFAQPAGRGDDERLLLPSAGIAVGGTAVVQRVNWSDVRLDRMRIEHSDTSFTAYYKAPDDDDGGFVRAGYMNLYDVEDDGRYWLNFIETTVQGVGIGMALLHAGIQVHGAVYAAVGMRNDQEVDGDDTRHLSEQGAALVRSARRNGLLRSEWCFNPADDAEGVADENPVPLQVNNRVLTMVESGLEEDSEIVFAYPKLPPALTTIEIYVHPVAGGGRYRWAGVSVHSAETDPGYGQYAEQDQPFYDSILAIKAEVAQHYGVPIGKIRETVGDEVEAKAEEGPDRYDQDSGEINYETWTELAIEAMETVVVERALGRFTMPGLRRMAFDGGYTVNMFVSMMENGTW